MASTSGKFHDVMMPTTPNGTRRAMLVRGALVGASCP
jgi:hypothetical protein